ncbi:peptidase C39 family protein [Candidatus Woesearchaeota archaeon]|nr:peptidase C39 family protein [Candidatus Woesearchaeota archaeon]
MPMQPYLRTTPYTTAASSLMAVINHFNPDFKLSRENEFLIWRETANLPIRASSIYGLAVFAKKQGLNPCIILEDKDYDYPDYRFKGYKKKEVEAAKYSDKLHYKEAKKLGIPIDERGFEFKEVRELARKGRIIMLRVNAGTLRERKSTSKYLVIHGYDKERKEFSVLDPKQGIVKVSDALLQEAFDTLATKKKRDHEMMVF